MSDPSRLCFPSVPNTWAVPEAAARWVPCSSLAVLLVPADAGRHSRLGLKCGCIREALKITSPELPYSVCGMAAPRCQAGNTRGLAFQLGEGKTLQQNFCAA